MGGSRVNRAGALLERHIVGQHSKDFAVEEGMAEGCAFQRAAGKAGDDRRLLEPRVLPSGFEQSLGDDINLFTVCLFYRHVFVARMEGDRHRSWKRPRRGRPDDGVDLFSGERRVNFFGRTGKRVLDPDARAGVLFVLDLGFGERGAIEDAPVDGTKAFVDESVLPEVEEDAGDYGLVFRRHRRVRVFEIAEDADAPKLLTLQVEIFLRVLATYAANFGCSHLEFLATQPFVDFDFVGKAVAGP